ncbi:hypothetical protein VNI00_017616 [Paramarasmius palmivorus]|uniref:JmjC domain-containing protein n=1 Tax=Paramarasmius palmivorus TaxID=297713 RepID=A0AAW0B3M7_9AGAR
MSGDVVSVYSRFLDSPLDILPKTDEDEGSWMSRINPEGVNLHPSTIRFFKTRPDGDEAAWKVKFKRNHTNLTAKKRAGPEKIKTRDRINQANSRQRKRQKVEVLDAPNPEEHPSPVDSPPSHDAVLATATPTRKLDICDIQRPFMEKGAERIIWQGDCGGELSMLLPSIAGQQGDNELEPTPLAEKSSDYVLRISPEDLPRDATQLYQVIREALSRNKMVHLVGYRTPTSTLSEFNVGFIKTHHISPTRPVTVHSLLTHTRYQTIDGCSDGTEQTDIGTFLERMYNPSTIEAVLAINMVGKTFGEPAESLNDVLTVCRNIEYEEANMYAQHALNHAVWGLLHHAGYFTFNHQDAGGELAVSGVEQGYKLWTGYFLRCENRILHEKEVEDLESRNIKTVTILLAPGDVHLQPPGLVHSVYTPVPCFMKGSSMWLYDTLHHTELSRRVECLKGNLVTNQDFDQELIYTQLTAMLFGLKVLRAMDPTFQFYEYPLLALCSMLLDASYYIPAKSKARLFPSFTMYQGIVLRSTYLATTYGALCLANFLAPSVLMGKEITPPQVGDCPQPRDKVKDVRQYLKELGPFSKLCENTAREIRELLGGQPLAEKGRKVDSESMDLTLNGISWDL